MIAVKLNGNQRPERITNLPLFERKEVLAGIVPTDTTLIAKTQFIEGNGEAYFDAVKKQSLEGIVLKRKDSRYEVGKRSHLWLKVVNYQYTDVFIVGYRKTGGFRFATDI